MATEQKTDLPWEETFVSIFKTRREQLELTQAAVAKRASESGLPFYQQTIQRIEDGKRPVRLNEALVLAAVVDLSLDEMIPFDGASEQTFTGKQDTYLHGEDLQDVVQQLQASYERIIVRSRLSAKNDSEFHEWLLRRHTDATEQQAQVLAKKHRIDKGSPEMQALLKEHPSPAMQAAADALDLNAHERIPVELSAAERAKTGHLRDDWKGKHIEAEG